jgi:DNA-binding response OmpR family regulator
VRILVVEDEEAVAEGLRHELTGEGYAVDVVRDGNEALEWAATYPYDLIVLDVVLPGRDGFASLRPSVSEARRRPC